MSVLSPLVRTVLLVKILLEATNARVNLAIQTGTVRQVSCLVKSDHLIDINEVHFSYWNLFP